jgi:hypothetical protein
MKQVLITIIFVITSVVFAADIQSDQDDIDLTLINDMTYDLSKPIFGTRPTLGRGLRDMQNSSGGSACTSCAH